MLKEIKADDNSYKILVEWKKADPHKWKAIQAVVDNIEEFINGGNRHEKLCYSEPVPQGDLLADMKKLLSTVNGVTAFHRHGNPTPKKKLDNLSNLNTEFYEKYMYEKEI